MSETYPTVILVAAEDAGQRLDQFLASRMNSVSRARVQQLIAEEKVLVNDAAAKASLKLRGGETVKVLGEARSGAAEGCCREDIPLDIVYEDDDLAVINKAAGMMVHAGAGATDDARNRGTLVNALLHHLEKLSGVGGELRPGIVHRLDKETSGLIIVAKNDEAHRKLGAAFAAREVKKKYVTLVHALGEKRFGDDHAEHQPRSGSAHANDDATGRRADGGDALPRGATVGYEVWKIYFARCEDRYRADAPDSGAYGGDGASRGGRYDVWCATGDAREVKCPAFGQSQGEISRNERDKDGAAANPAVSLPRNFLHAAELEFRHPRTGRRSCAEE